MNYKNRDDELIKKQRRLQDENRIKVTQRENAINRKVYSGKALDALAKGQYSQLREQSKPKAQQPVAQQPVAQQPTNMVPELKRPSKNLREQGFPGSYNSDPIDFDYVMKNDRTFGSKGFGLNLIQNDLNERRRNGRYDSNNAEYYKRFGMSKNDVLDQYEKYQMEKHPILYGLQDFASAPDRALASAAGTLSHKLLPYSDLDNMINSDFFQGKNKEVQRRRDYALDSDKLTDTQKGLTKAALEGGDFLTNMALSSVIGGGLAVGDAAAGIGASIEPAKWLLPVLNGTSAYGLTAENTRHDLEKQGVDRETATDYANTQGIIWGGIDALTAGAGSKAGAAAKIAGKSAIQTAVKSAAKGFGVGVGKQAASEIANKLILGDQGTFASDVQKYMDSGLSEDKATTKAFGNILARSVGSGLLSSVLAGSTSLVGSGLSKALGNNASGAIDDSLNEVFQGQAKIGMNDPLALPQNDIPSLEGLNQLALPEKQLPANVIQLPGTNGIIPLEGTVAPTVKNAAARAASNPRLVIPLEGAELEKANARLNELKTTIKGKKTEVQAAKEAWQNAPKKNKKAANQKYQASKAELAALQDESKELELNVNGGTRPAKDMIKKQDADLYNEIYGRKTGVMDYLNYAAKFAGDTPEAKQLSKDIKNTLEEYIETGDAFNTILAPDNVAKVAQLDELAKTNNKEYLRTTFSESFAGYDPNTDTFDYDNPSIWNKLYENDRIERINGFHEGLAQPSNVGVDNDGIVPYNEGTKGEFADGRLQTSRGNDGTGSTGILRGIRENGELGAEIRGNELEGRRQLPANSVLSPEQLSQGNRVYSDTEINTLKQSGIDTPNYYNSNNDAQLFTNALETAKQANKNGAAVDSHSVEEIQDIINNGGNVFLVEDASAGYAVEGNGNLTAVFKNPSNNTKGMASKITLAGIKNGAVKGDCFGIKLVNMYARGGLEPVARMKYGYGFNEAMDNQVRDQLQKGLISREPDVYVLKLKDGYDFEKAASEFNNAKQYTQAELDALPEFTDYDEMLAYRDSLIKQPINKAASSMPENTSVDPAYELAEQYAGAFHDFDPYGEMDNMFENDSFVEQMARDISEGNDLTPYIEAIENVIEDAPDVETRTNMIYLIDRLSKANEGRIETDGQLTAEEMEALQAELADAGFDWSEPTPASTNNTPAPEAPTTPVDNGYWLRVLGDNDFLMQEAQKQNVSPQTLLEYAGKNLGYDAIPRVTPGNGGGNVPPKSGNNTPPPDDIPPINLSQDANGNVKESGTSKHIRHEDTAMKYDNISDEVVSDFVSNPGMYKQLRNADTKALADAIYNSGDTPITINGKLYKGDAEAKFWNLLEEKNPASLPLGTKIAADYSAQGNHDMAAQIYRNMESALTSAGQFSQAAIISMTKNDPLTALAYMEKQIDSLNKAGKNKYGKRWNNFVLTDDEKKLFDNIKPGDTQAIINAYNKVGARIEKEYPASFMEKVLEFRRVAMLFNSRTIARNTFANVPTAGMRYVADRIEGVGQAFASLVNPEFERTQSIRGSNVKTRKLAIEIFNSDKVQKMLKEVPGRLSEVPQVGDYAKRKQVFKGGVVSNFINKLTGNGIEKLNAKLGKENAGSALELMRNAAYSALEVTDSPFVRENFISRLGSYMRVKGITDVKDVPDEAINVALEEALKATYKDNSWLVQAIKKVKGGIETVGNNIVPGLGDIASQALIPYVQAPGNIGARIVDYSPIGGAKGIAKIIQGATKGNADTIRDGINQFSKGAAGTLIAGLGMALYKSGIITGANSEDKDQKAFDKQNGFREFSLRWTSPLDGKVKYDTLDWAQPFIDTLMMGVLMQQAIDESDKYDSDILNYFGIEGSTAGKLMGVAEETAKKNVNYFFDATPLKNLSDLFKTNNKGETDIAENIKENTIEDFASGLVPAGVNAVAKSVDPTQRQTYDPSNTFASFLNSNIAKLPGLSKTLPVKYNTWGEPITYGNSKGEAAFSKMLYPGEHTTDTEDAINKEINRLFDVTQEAAVFPQVAPSKVDGVALTAKQVSNYQETMGKRNRKLVETLVNSKDYKKLDDSVKAEVIKDLFSFSKAAADNEIAGKEYSKTNQKLADIYAEGKEKGLVDELVNRNFKTSISDVTGIDSDNKLVQEIADDLKAGKKGVAEQKIQTATQDKQNLDALNKKYGLEMNLSDYQKAKESGNPDIYFQNKKDLKEINEKYDTNMDMKTYKKYGSKQQAEQHAKEIKEAKDVGMVTKDGNAQPEQLQKARDKAGSQWRKLEHDLPTLKGMGLDTSAIYTYASAIKKNGSINPTEFASTYNQINTNTENGMTQDEVLAYLNKGKYTQDEAMDIWTTYGEDWKQVPALVGGTWKKKKKK